MANVSPIDVLEVSSYEGLSISNLESQECQLEEEMGMENKPISADEQSEEIRNTPKKEEGIRNPEKRSDANDMKDVSDKKDFRTTRSNAINIVPNNQESPQTLLDCEQTKQEIVSNTRQSRFKAIILDEHSEFSWIQLLSRTFGSVIVGFLITTPLSLIPLHDLVQYPEYWYEICFAGTYALSLIAIHLIIVFGSYMNISDLLLPRAIGSMFFSGSVYSICLLLITYFIWTHFNNYQYPMPFTGFASIIPCWALGYLHIWLLIPKKLRQNRMLLKRFIWMILIMSFGITYGYLSTVIIETLKRSSDKYQPLVALMLPAWREVYVWIIHKMMKKATSGDLCGSMIFFKYTTNVFYGIQLCIILGTLATDATSWTLIGVDYLMNIYLCIRIV